MLPSSGWLDQANNTNKRPELFLLPIPDVASYSNGVVGTVESDLSLSPVSRIQGQASASQAVYRNGLLLGFLAQIQRFAVYTVILLDSIIVPELPVLPLIPEESFNPIVVKTLCPDPVALSSIEECCREG